LLGIKAGCNVRAWLFYRLEPGTASAQEQQRLKALSELGLIEAQTIPIFEEATQTAAYLLDSHHLGFLDQNRFWFKSQWVYQARTDESITQIAAYKSPTC